MNEFDNTQWCSTYLLSYNFSGIGDPNKTRFASACFTNGCTYGLRDAAKTGISYYEFRIPRTTKFIEAGFGTWCPFTMEQIIATLEDINDLVPFKFRIESTDELYKIFAEVNQSLHYKVHFYLLTRIRYLYEFPQCVFYYDAMRLKDLPEFKDETLSNLYTLVVDSFLNMSNSNSLGIRVNGRSLLYDHYHSVPMMDAIDNSVKTNSGLPRTQFCSGFISNEEIRKFIQSKISMSALNNMQVRKRISIKKLPIELIKFFNCLSFWETPKFFEELRLPFYKYNYRVLLSEFTERQVEYAKPFLYKNTEEDQELYNSLEEIISKFEIPENYMNLAKEIKENSSEIDMTHITRNQNLLRGQHDDWQHEIRNQITAWNLSIVEKKKSTFEQLHPRDSHGRFISKSQVNQ